MSLPLSLSDVNYLLYKGDPSSFNDHFNDYKRKSAQDLVTLFPFFGHKGKWKRLRRVDHATSKYQLHGPFL